MGDSEESEELGSVTKGKQGELIVLGKLLERGFKVYQPMVDTGIDCLVDVGGGAYKEIQVKSREGEPIFQARQFEPRDNFYFICFLRGKHDDDYWILPSKVFKGIGRQSKVGNREYIQLRIGKEGSENYSALAQYHSNWGILLSGATKEIKKTVEGAFKRVEGEHLKIADYEREILAILYEQNGFPLQTKEIIAKLASKLGGTFSKADLGLTRPGTTRPRWEKTARFAIYQFLKKQKLIEAPTPNQWIITEKGKQFSRRNVVEDMARVISPATKPRLLFVKRAKPKLLISKPAQAS